MQTLGIAFILLSEVVASSDLRGIRGIKKSPVDYANEASDIAKMMESVREKTEGKKAMPKKKALVEQTVSKSSSGEMFPGLDDELMKKADDIAEEIRQQSSARETPKKLSALAATKDDEVARHDRAARYFATHGMKDLGGLLGDTLSASAEKKAIDEDNKEKAKLAQSVGRSFDLPSISSSSPSMPVATSSTSLDDIPLDDDEEAMQKKWKAVDALRMKHHSLV
mmetsp:Transcript_67722/g.107267  ORF Transcript_67722/g.107267 Transcript_67722/m.107267 type:complete len:224 (+) Transcript_67722:71-742(+)|eukprot:CAMPEP_0169112594 /NCGR_PEP_ID=MMETSP1015-20121227/27725_1 /TAXON_ID=342587 /ORGANISM="Karlodinium micrum, Strain CCMP2283" /LENGTH=223 /DNA_ID=CAMNT_0009174655 /DNA_START=64 /DNA_END=735 /DNA_ORIENTATION=-